MADRFWVGPKRWGVDLEVGLSSFGHGQRNVYPSESSTWAQPHSHGAVRQVTNHPSIHHHPFFYIPAYDDEMARLIFVSHRTGQPEIFAEMQGSQGLLQLTQHDGLSEWSITPSHDGRHVYFTDDSVPGGSTLIR